MNTRREKPSRPEAALGLQRPAGNRAVQRWGGPARPLAGNRALRALVQRASSSGSGAALEQKAQEAVGRYRRGLTHAQEIRKIADELIEKELGSKPTRRIGARRNGLAEIARRGGPESEKARRIGRTLAEIEAELDRRAAEVVLVTDDLIEEKLGARPKSPKGRENALKKLAGKGGDVGDAASNLQKQLREAEAELAGRKPSPKRPSKGERWRRRYRQEQEAFAKSQGAAAKAEGAATKAAAEAEGATVKEVEKVAAKEVEKAATKGGRLYARVAAKIGIELVEALVPDPLDAIDLMVDFVRAFAEAKEAIRQRNLENGFAIGWAAYLVIPRWEWAKWFAHTAVSKDVVTEILGTAGVAENAFNEGLVRGFIYGEKHTTAQGDRVRQKAFDAVLKATGHTPGRYDGDDLYTFGRDDVYSFAAALWPAAVEFLEEASRRRAARLERERLAKHAKDVERRFGTGASWPR
jgi:hypothetical protein